YIDISFKLTDFIGLEFGFKTNKTKIILYFTQNMIKYDKYYEERKYPYLFSYRETVSWLRAP
ncbi:MAG TPA: hypothetical protein PK761_07845, partial [Clostridia bacterium]|nr:hypothetical protein [Clostridia bacterium]HOR90358.1 hypothetical protein [Clostridia bacterium]HPL08883.1 hypothetical protein [Clostridia bacterium]